MRVLAVCMILFACATAFAGTTQLIPWATADGGYGSGAIFGLAVEGDTAYLQLTLNSRVQVVRVDNLSGTQSQTQLVSQAQWLAASGATSCSSYQGFDLSGSNYVQFADATSDEIWRVNKVTGALIKYVNKHAITSVTGRTSLNLGAVQCVIPANGEHLFYESTSTNILTTTGPNACSIVFGEAQLLAAFGPGVLPSGGMNFDHVGNLYFGSSTGSLCRYTGGSLTTILTRAAITNLTLLSSAGFGTMKAGPDGKFYFRNGSGTFTSLLRFDPANPADTLEVIVSASELTNSVAASANVNCIRWYNNLAGGGWAWHQFGQNGVYLTQIPEPWGIASLFVMCVGGLARRRNYSVHCSKL